MERRSIDQDLSTLCSICKRMDFTPLMFRPQDAQLLLDGGPWDTTFTAYNSFQHELGGLAIIDDRAERCALCRVIAMVIRTHVDPELIAAMAADQSYFWQLSLSTFGSFGPNIPEPPYEKSLTRLRLFQRKEISRWAEAN